MSYKPGYFKSETYKSSVLGDTNHSLRFVIGENTRYAEGKMPQVAVTLFHREGYVSSYFIDLNKIDEVITALAWAKHRMQEELDKQ